MLYPSHPRFTSGGGGTLNRQSLVKINTALSGKSADSSDSGVDSALPGMFFAATDGRNRRSRSAFGNFPLALTGDLDPRQDPGTDRLWQVGPGIDHGGRLGVIPVPGTDPAARWRNRRPLPEWTFKPSPT